MVVKGRFSKKAPPPVVRIPKNHNPYITHIASLKKKPRQQEATDLLFDIANIVTPIMKEYGFAVKSLVEMSPRDDNLLGLNVNHGSKILLRLRPPYDETSFLPKEQLIGTMLHELTHNRHGPHDAKFYRLLDEITEKQESYMMKGVDGKRMRDPYEGLGNKLGGKIATNIREARLKRLATLYTGGANKLGGQVKNGNLKDLVRAAALKRYEDNKWCHAGEAEDLPKDEDLIIIDDDHNDDEFILKRKRREEVEESRKRPAEEVVIVDDDGNENNDGDNRNGTEIIDLT